MRTDVVGLVERGLLERALGPGVVVSRRERRWLGLADDAVGFLADDDVGWRRLLTEGALARRWRSAGVPVFEVLAEDPAARLQVRRRLHGVTGAEVEPRLFGVDPATVDRYSPAAPLTAFGARLADSYGALAARIAGATSALDGAALGLADHPLPDLDEALHLLAASGVDGVVVERARGCRAWLEGPSPTEDSPRVAVHGDLHFHNLVLADDGAITGVFDLDAAALSTRWTDLQYAPGLGPAFLARVVRAYAAEAGQAVDADAVRREHLRVALGHLRWHPPGSPRHDEVVGWVQAALLALAPRPRYRCAGRSAWAGWARSGPSTTTTSGASWPARSCTATSPATAGPAPCSSTRPGSRPSCSTPGSPRSTSSASTRTGARGSR